MTEMKADMKDVKEDTAANQQDIVDLQTSVDGSIAELNGEVTSLQIDPCYRYDLTPVGLSWDAARANCLSRGGDLAYHGVENLELRWRIATDFGHRGSNY